MRKWQLNVSKIAVVGCGPAGLAFVAAMSNSEHEIVMFERFSYAKAVGSGIILQPTGLAVASVLGIREHIERQGHAIYRVLGHTTENMKLVVDVDYSALSNGHYAVALHRSVLFDALQKRIAKCRIPMILGANIRSFARYTNGQVKLRDESGTIHGPFDLIVDASGARSALRTQVFNESASAALKYGSLWGTFDLQDGVFLPHTLQQRFASGNVSIGVMPIGHDTADGPPRVAFFWNIKCTNYPDWLMKPLQDWKKDVLRIWPKCTSLVSQIDEHRQLTFAEYRHHASSNPSRRGIVFIGDASHATSPMLGQGVNMSLLDAATLAQALNSDAPLNEACTQYASLRKYHVSVVQTLAKVLIPFYQSDNRVAIALRDLLFQPASRLPYMRQLIATIVAGNITDPLKILGVLDSR